MFTKIILTIALFGLVIAVSAAIECPADQNQDSDPVFIPHETDCTLYYICDNGEAQLLNCRDGLYFNPQLDVCDWPENVDCTSEPEPTQEPEPEPTEEPEPETSSEPERR